MTPPMTPEPHNEGGAFWGRVQIDSDGCWRWKGSISRQGYGSLTIKEDGKSRIVSAHRMAFRLHHGKWPDQCIDHLCRNRSCCNPAHLEDVSNKENVLRGEGLTAQNARKTHCSKGHELTGENLLIRKYAGQPDFRGCRTCRLTSLRAYQKRRREKYGK